MVLIYRLGWGLEVRGQRDADEATTSNPVVTLDKYRKEHMKRLLPESISYAVSFITLPRGSFPASVTFLTMSET